MIELPDSVHDLVATERQLLTDLLVLLGKLDAEPQDVSDVRTALADLDGLFMLVVAGEFNAGKSSLVNALLGERVMPEGVTPTTDRVTLITYGPEASESSDGPNVVRRTYPNPLLDAVAFVDTPGTNAIVAKHQELSERFVPRADLVVFVTSADRPFTQSERTFLELIASWGRKVIMVVNKFDILEQEDERRKVLDYVRENARETLGVNSVEVFGVSARLGLAARQAKDEAAYAASGMIPLEKAIAGRLGTDRVKLKLASPLGVAAHAANQYLTVLDNRLELLQDDNTTLAEIDRQRKQFDRDMQRDLSLYIARLKGVLQQIEKRGEDFFDETIRLTRIPKLMNTERVKEAFQQKVVGKAEAEIDSAMHDLTDWFIQRNLQLWEDVMRYLNERRAAEQANVIGEVGGRFQYDRQALVRSLRETAEEALEEYDPKSEASRLAERLQGAVVQTGIMEVGGLGLSAALVAMMTGAALDITGIALGLTVMGAGLLVLPGQKRKAKRELRERMTELQDTIEKSVRQQFELELSRSQEKLTGAISPYTRFVGAELEHLHELRADLSASADRVTDLQRQVEALS
ncbi:MAG: dynamin family protein [Trueperaceae bacterium]